MSDAGWTRVSPVHDIRMRRNANGSATARFRILGLRGTVTLTPGPGIGDLVRLIEQFAEQHGGEGPG